MYSLELEKHKKEKEEWRRKAEALEDKASALQVSLHTHRELTFCQKTHLKVRLYC